MYKARTVASDLYNMRYKMWSITFSETSNNIKLLKSGT